MQELLDLVDKDDHVIGQMPRPEVHARKLSNYRVVNAFIINDNGELWIPRRTKDKDRFPLCLDASAAGHVMAGETYQEAFARELMEEVCINIASKGYILMGALNPFKHQTGAFMEVYCIKSNDVPDYNHEDFIEYYWLTPHDLLKAIERGEAVKPDLPIIMREFFLGRIDIQKGLAKKA